MYSLTKDDLEGAAYICLGMAATTDLDEFPPGSGGMRNRYHHDRRRRFEAAVPFVEKGTPLVASGLTPEDCAWAASQAKRARNPDEWREHFTSAEKELRAAAELKKGANEEVQK